MTKRILTTACLLGLVTAPLWAADMNRVTETNWDAQLLSVAIFDNRTDLEKVQDQVSDLSQALASAQQQIADLQGQLDAQTDVLLDQESELQTLAGAIHVENDKVTIIGSSVDIDAAAVSVNAATTDFGGIVSCEVLTTEFVDAKEYTPGAGNIW